MPNLHTHLQPQASAASEPNVESLSSTSLQTCIRDLNEVSGESFQYFKLLSFPLNILWSLYRVPIQGSSCHSSCSFRENSG